MVRILGYIDGALTVSARGIQINPRCLLAFKLYGLPTCSSSSPNFLEPLDSRSALSYPLVDKILVTVAFVKITVEN